MKWWSIILLFLALSACAFSVDGTGLHVTNVKSPSAVLDQVRKISAGDLGNAIAKASAADDKIGLALWTCLAPIVRTPNPHDVGVATLLEDVRIATMCLPINPGSAILP